MPPIVIQRNYIFGIVRLASQASRYEQALYFRSNGGMEKEQNLVYLQAQVGNL